MAKRKYRYAVGMIPASNTPQSAPSVVAISSTMARRILVRPCFQEGRALAHEQAITETMLAPMAVWISTEPNRVRTVR